MTTTKCSTWKQSKSTKGFYKRKLGVSYHWYTVTSTIKQPERRRNYDATWSGALQLGRNVYISGGPFSGTWFEYYGVGSKTGHYNYRVHGAKVSDQGTLMIVNFMEYYGIPYVKAYAAGVNKYYVKVPGRVLEDLSWPWSRALGYPTKWEYIYWVWEEGGQRIKVSKSVYEDWYDYIDIVAILNEEEKELFKREVVNDFKKKQGNWQDILGLAIAEMGAYDAWAYYQNVKDYYKSIGWTTKNVNEITAQLWEDLWNILTDPVYNYMWWGIHGYYKSGIST